MVSVMVLAIGAVIYYNANKYSFINNKVGKIVADKTDSLYKISYDSISVNEAGGDLYIHNLSIKGDTILQKQYMQNGDTAAVPMLLHIFVPVLKVEGFKTASALLNKQLACDRIIISDPRITVYVFAGVAKDNDIKQQGQQLYKQLLGNFNLIQADSVSVINSEVVLRDFLSREIKFHTFNTSINLTDLRIDSTHNYDTSRTLFSKEISLHSDKVIIGDEPVIGEATNLTFNTRSKLLAMSAIEYNGIKNGGSMSGKVEGVSISGIEAAGAVEAMNIAIGKAAFKKASIQIKSKQKEAGNKSKASGDQLLTGWVKTFKMKEMQAGNLSLKMESSGKGASDLLINNSVITIDNLALDTISKMDNSLLGSADNFTVSNDLISIKSKDNLYVYNFSGLKVNKANKTISLIEFAVKPLLGETAFANKVRVQKDRYDIRMRNLTASAVDFDKLLDGKIDIGTVKTSGNSIKIYRDVSHPSDSILKVGKYPHQAIYKLKMPINIGRFIAVKTLVEYKERNPLSDTSGNLRFENSTLTLDNITNAPRPANKITNMNFDGALLGKIPLKVNIKFYLENVKEGHYQVNASIKRSFNAAILNPMVEPMGLVRMEKGKFNELTFNFMADNINAQGELVAKYEDLKLSLLKRDKKNNTLNKKSVTSLLANVIVKNNNPANGKLRKADVVYKRDEYKSFFNMIWKFVFTGLKDVMGAKL